MSRYDFKCPICDRVEETHSYDEVPICWHDAQGVPSPTNDHISAVEMKRMYSIGGVHFKGSGFYKTDTSDKK